MGIRSWIKSRNEKVFYFPGCQTPLEYKDKEINNYTEIFNLLGIKYQTSDKKLFCGLNVMQAGYKKEARKIAEKNHKFFISQDITKIITSCPSCFYMLSQVYPSLLKDWKIEVEHSSISILKALNKKGIKNDYLEEDKDQVTYHDSCHLSRMCNIYEEPRSILKALGTKIIELKDSKTNSSCCGAGGGLIDNFSQTTSKIAEKRLNQVPVATKLISPGFFCHQALSSGQDTIEFSSFILGKLRGLNNR